MDPRHRVDAEPGGAGQGAGRIDGGQRHRDEQARPGDRREQDGDAGVAIERATTSVAIPIPNPPAAVSTAPIQFASGSPRKPRAVIGMPTTTAPSAASSQRLGRRVQASAPASGRTNPAKWKWTAVSRMIVAENPNGWTPSRSVRAKTAPTARNATAASVAWRTVRPEPVRIAQPAQAGRECGRPGHGDPRERQHRREPARRQPERDDEQPGGRDHEPEDERRRPRPGRGHLQQPVPERHEHERRQEEEGNDDVHRGAGPVRASVLLSYSKLWTQNSLLSRRNFPTTVTARPGTAARRRTATAPRRPRPSGSSSPRRGARWAPPGA